MDEAKQGKFCRAGIKKDGIGFINIFLPYIPRQKPRRGTIFFSFVLNCVYGFSGFFPIIYILTKGGPAYGTTTIDYLIYLRAFRTGGEINIQIITENIAVFDAISGKNLLI